MNKKSFLLILISIVWISKGFAQLNHAIKAEVAYLQFGFNTLNVDPGPIGKDTI
ncbi:hypothetical protein ABWH96_17945 [Marivirga tractuosa]|uniref:hypothetical protein n=1 Tax=Marivirga tractuosa TaxID=1006 RepID=UPI0035CF465B